MTDKPRRPWFQLHLSTAIVMMFVAAGLIWANTSRSVHFSDPEFYVEKFGWPNAMCRRISYVDIDSNGNESRKLSDWEWEWKGNHPVYWNALSAVFVMIGSSLAVEWLIRRSETRAP